MESSRHPIFQAEKGQGASEPHLYGRWRWTNSNKSRCTASHGKTEGTGYCHFPVDRVDTRYFEQLTAEQLVTHPKTGRLAWEKKDYGSNEAWDCRIYAYGALKIVRPNLEHPRISGQNGYFKPGKKGQGVPKKSSKFTDPLIYEVMMPTPKGTYNRRMLAKINALLEGKTVKDVQQYTINGRSLTKYTFGELRQLKVDFEKRCLAETA